MGALAFSLPGSSWAAGALREGAAVPGVSFLDGKGGTFTLSERLGEALLVNFWATWCRPCVTELPELERLHVALADAPKVSVIAINVDEGADPAVIRETMLAKGYTMALGFEPTRAAADAFGLVTIPMSVVIGPDGKVRHILRGVKDWSNPQWANGLRQLVAGN